MNQHFVPEFYLKNFSPNGKQIFVYDKIIKKSFSSSISSVASKEGFYDDSNNNSIENNIGKLESKTGVVVKELIALIENKQFTKVSKYQKDMLLKFIWLQTNKTVESRIEYATLAPFLYSKLSKTAFEVNANDLLKNSKSTDEHIKLTNSSLNNSYALNILNDRNFIVVKNETEIDLITSDDPVIKYTHWKISHQLREMFLPLNPKLGIWVIPKSFHKELDNADNKLCIFKENDNILFYNYLQVYQSTRQIFSKEFNFKYVQDVLQQNPSFGDINKKRME